MTSQPHLENRIPIHQAHSRFFGESQSPDSGCARICLAGTARHHRKERKEGLWLVLSDRERETVGCQYRVAPGIGHDRKRGQ